MIKVHTDVMPTSDGLDLDTEVLVAVPKGLSEDLSDLLCKHEITSLLKKMYEQHPDVIVDAIEEFIEEMQNDKTDINND